MSTPTILQTNSEKKASSLLEQISRAAPISVQFSPSVVSDSLWPHGLQHTRLPCLSPTPRAYSNSCPLRRWCLQPSHPLSSPSPPAFNLSQHQGFSKWVSSSHQVVKVLEFQLQHQSFHEHPGLISFRMDWLDFLVVQDAQGSSPTPQFKRINSSLLSFHYSPTSPSIHDYWKTHSFH